MQTVKNKNRYNRPNVMVISDGCQDDDCKEETKRLVGWGTRIISPEMIQKGDTKRHFNMYECDNKRCPKYPDCDL